MKTKKLFSLQRNMARFKMKREREGGDIFRSFNTERCSQSSTFDKMMVGRNTMKEGLMERTRYEKGKEQRTACLQISWAFVKDFHDGWITIL
jgi:hypothetical protein